MENVTLLKKIIPNSPHQRPKTKEWEQYEVMGLLPSGV